MRTLLFCMAKVGLKRDGGENCIYERVQTFPVTEW